MCAIVDANVAGEVFGESPSPAGKFFFDWLNTKGRLAVGGLLTAELSRNQKFVRWLGAATRVGRANTIPSDRVETEAELLRQGGNCQSNDWHILGLAIASGARLLFTNDHNLQTDFTSPGIVSGVRGRVFTTVARKDIRRTHRDLLNRTDLCQI